MGLDQEVLERFKERIATGLNERPLRITPEEHRERLRELIANAASQDYFELLGLSLAADDEAVVVAYESRARVTHPLNAERLGMEPSVVLGFLFERLTEAYLALSDRHRRRAYLAWLDLPPRSTAGEPGPAATRNRELARLARDAYLNALSLVTRAEYFPAISLLERAVALEPRSEYLALLARCQAQNPQWLARAVVNLERALDLDPGNAEVLCDLGEIHERSGDADQARTAFKGALAISPGHDRARRLLDRLGGSALHFGRREALE